MMTIDPRKERARTVYTVRWFGSSHDEKIRSLTRELTLGYGLFRDIHVGDILELKKIFDGDDSEALVIAASREGLVRTLSWHDSKTIADYIYEPGPANVMGFYRPGDKDYQQCADLLQSVGLEPLPRTRFQF